MIISVGRDHLEDKGRPPQTPLTEVSEVENDMWESSSQVKQLIELMH